MSGHKLQAQELTNTVHSADLTLQSTQEIDSIEDLGEVLGQPRAVESLQFATGISKAGFNIFVLGPSGTGKHALARQISAQRALHKPPPADWCYVNNFEDSTRPRMLKLPSGQGRQFVQDIQNMVLEARNSLKTAFESEEYQNRLQALEQELKEQQQHAFQELQQKAQEKGLSLIRTPSGIGFAPLKDSGEVMAPEEFNNLPEEQRKKLEEEIQILQQESQKIFQKIPLWQKQLREKIQELDREVAEYAISPLIQEVRDKYQDQEKVQGHLEELEKDILHNLHSFLHPEGQQKGQPDEKAPPSSEVSLENTFLRRYKVNLLVDHSELASAPVIYEDNPTYANLVGKVEHMPQMGALITDFNLIKPGALHRANSGYLILDAQKVLTQPGAWEALKRAIKSGEIRVESLAEMFSLISTLSLEPEPIPLDVKIILVGSPFIYYLLHELDPEFAELFKVSADFDFLIANNNLNQDLYLKMLRSIIARQELKHFDRQAVLKLMAHSSRLAGDKEKFTAKIREISDLMQEADFWAGEHSHNLVSADDVQKAIDAKTYRSDRIRARIQEEIQRGTLRIDTQGRKVGQINGLSVLQLGDFMFGRPNRITSRVHLGKGDLINIEREVKLSGPLHSKGVLILSGFLGARYALDKPLSLNGTLVFEQSYAGIEGDSASSAELFALLSAISEVALNQELAVTGAVDQYGSIQAIGGVNEKIEGFFDVCKLQGWTKNQGVLIPESNVKHLMLREDVIQAVQAGEFHIYAIQNIDQGLELLTGMPAGQADEHNQFPAGSVNAMIQERLQQFAEFRKSFAASAGQGGQIESGE